MIVNDCVSLSKTDPERDWDTTNMQKTDCHTQSVCDSPVILYELLKDLNTSDK